MTADLRCRVGDVALIIKGPWAGMVVDVIGYERVEPFDWVVCSCGGPFSFPADGTPDSPWARAIDHFLDPIRPAPDDDGQAQAAPEPIHAVVWTAERATQAEG